jgi:hypothetical protein
MREQHPGQRWHRLAEAPADGSQQKYFEPAHRGGSLENYESTVRSAFARAKSL